MSTPYSIRTDNLKKYRSSLRQRIAEGGNAPTDSAYFHKKISLNSPKAPEYNEKSSSVSNKALMSPFSKAESDTNSEFNKTLDSKVSVSSISIEEKQMMIQMQRKLEMIESKLNYFMEESSSNDHSQRTGVPILSNEETKFLEQARYELYSRFEPNSEYHKSMSKSSLQGAEDRSVLSEYLVGGSVRNKDGFTAQNNINNGGLKNNFRQNRLTSDLNSVQVESYEVSNQHGGGKLTLIMGLSSLEIF